MLRRTRKPFRFNRVDFGFLSETSILSRQSHCISATRCDRIRRMRTPLNAMEKRLRLKKAERRHVAIVFTDIEDSTLKTSNHGDSAWKILCDQHFEIAQRCIRDNKGALVKTVGDAVLAVFADGSEGAKFALDFQDKLRPWNAKRRKGPTILVRIGLHVGDVFIGKGDIAGTEANRASRVAGLAKGGQIVGSLAARRAVEILGLPWLRKAQWADLGEKSLKGLEPERVSELSWRPSGVQVTDGEMETARKTYARKLLKEEFRLVNLLGFPELKDRPQIELPRVFVMPQVEGGAQDRLRGRPRAGVQEHVGTCGEDAP